MLEKGNYMTQISHVLFGLKFCMKGTICVIANQNSINLHEFFPVNSLEYHVLKKTGHYYGNLLFSSREKLTGNIVNNDPFFWLGVGGRRSGDSGR